LLSFEIQRQPDDETCGPTCLHAIYRYFNDPVPFEQVLTEVQALELGGTLGVILASHAMARGYKATILTWNLAIFDPSWFALPKGEMQKRLRERAAIKEDPKLRFASNMYAEFLDNGGTIEMHDLRPALLRKYLKRRLPILTGLSATFLYRDPREIGRTNQPDDIRGEPVGHFTVLTGYAPGRREVYVSDPMYPNPLSKTHTYPVSIERVVGAIYLGVLTYDANLVVLQPPS
jgi:hypothetical protein